MSGKKPMSDEIGLQRAQLSGVNLKMTYGMTYQRLKTQR